MMKRAAFVVFSLVWLVVGCVGLENTVPAGPPNATTTVVLTDAPSPTATPVGEQATQAVTAAPPTRPTPEGPMPPQAACEATAPDMLGPFYTPGAPARTSVGKGYVLSGVARSVEDCMPIPGAMIELWMAGPDGQYSDDYRATIIADANGRYRFETPIPVPYESRPPHIHLKVSAPGYQALVTQHYPTPGQTEAQMDLVLVK